MRKVPNKYFILMFVIMLTLLVSFPSYASSPRVSGISRTDYMTKEQFEQILGTLRQMKGNISRGNYNFQNTGVYCASKEDAAKIISGFKELFLVGCHSFAIFGYTVSKSLKPFQALWPEQYGQL